MKKNLTLVVVASAKVPPGHPYPQIDIWDRTLRGFGLRVAATGRKTWMLMYRFNGVKKRLRLGEYDPGYDPRSMGVADARAAARIALGKIAAGLDPAVEKAEEKAQDRDAESFASIADLFLKEYVSKKRPATQREYRQIVNCYLVPAWGTRKARDVTRANIKVLLGDVRTRTEKGVIANRTLAVLRKLFGWAVDEGLIHASPAYKVARPVQEHARERVLSSTEICALWAALAGQPPRVAAFFKIATLTCQRRSEILGASWDELDLDRGWWSIPGTRTKNGHSHRVYLVPAVIEILNGIKAQQQPAQPYVFPGRFGRPVDNLQRAVRNLKTAGVDVRAHDLRRTSSTLMTANGVRKDVVARILNHAQVGETSRVYDQYSYDKEKRSGLTKLASVVQAIVEGPGAPGREGRGAARLNNRPAIMGAEGGAADAHTERSWSGIGAARHAGSAQQPAGRGITPAGTSIRCA